MNYGLYLSASGVLTNSYRQDVFANNLANVNTVGFKPDIPTLAQRAAESQEDQTPFGTAQDLLDRLGGGVMAGRQVTNFAAGAIEKTGRPLDVALSEGNSFLAVQSSDPTTGNTSVRLTRDGRLAVDPSGRLVTISGHTVLDESDKPITLSPDRKVTITADGRVQQDGADVAKLQVARVTDLQRLEKAGANLFSFSGNDPRTVVEQPTLHVGALESSATNAIDTLMSIMAATKTATANANLIKYHDTLMDRAINTLGRVA